MNMLRAVTPARPFLRSVWGSVAPPFVLRSMASATTAQFEKVRLQRQGGKSEFDVYVVGKEGAPGVIVLQEWWGVDYEVKNHAIHISQMGFRSLIPDLYRGKVGLDAAEAQHLMDSLDWPGAIEDIAASVKWLKESGSKKVGVTGFCMGGALSIASAVLVPEVDAVVAFYGIPSGDLAAATTAKVPVQGHFGELDQFTGFADVQAAKDLEEKSKAAGVDNEVYIYPNVGHAFMNSSPEAIKRKKECGFPEHNQEAVELAWSRFSSWFHKYLS